MIRQVFQHLKATRKDLKGKKKMRSIIEEEKNNIPALK
jgi:hypothetical protein